MVGTGRGKVNDSTHVEVENRFNALYTNATMNPAQYFPSLPAVDDSAAIAAFAGTFDGYRQFGSVGACAEEAMKKRRLTLIDIRNELFFEVRASYHRNDDDYLEVYRLLFPLFQKFAAES